MNKWIRTYEHGLINMNLVRRFDSFDSSTLVNDIGTNKDITRFYFDEDEENRFYIDIEGDFEAEIAEFLADDERILDLRIEK